MDDTSLKAHLFHAFSGFADKRIKDLKKSRVFAVDDRQESDFGADKTFLSYFCAVWLRVVGPDAVEIRLSGSVPMSDNIREWVAADNSAFDSDGYEPSLVINLRLGEEGRLEQLADRIEEIVRPGAPRYSVPSYKYMCPRTANSLRRLATILREFHATP